MGWFPGSGRWKPAAGAALGAPAWVHRPLPPSALRIRLTPALENDPT